MNPHDGEIHFAYRRNEALDDQAIIYNHHQYLWDMKVIQMLREGRTRELVNGFSEFVNQAVSEADAGSFTWLLSALDFPDYAAEIYAYGSVIGTGNVVASWIPGGAP